jgi:hypothetical protein
MEASVPDSSLKTTAASSKRKRGFELNSKGLFLTYPQCALSPQEALDLLTGKLSTKKRTITEYLIATEKHADGNDHLHCWIKMNKPLFIREPTWFDLNNHHGNYQGARNATRVKAYCAKEGNFIACPPYDPTPTKTTWTTAIGQAESGEISAALTTLKTGGERSCRDLVLHGPAIKASLLSMRPPTALTCARPVTDYEHLFEWDKSRLLLLCGATNTGKTTLAASLLPLALFTRHLDLLADLKEGHTGVILDDMSFVHLHDEAQIHLCDTAMESNVHVRYRVATLPAGLPRIVTTNKEPFEVFHVANPAIARRIQAIRWLGWQEGWEPAL